MKILKIYQIMRILSIIVTSFIGIRLISSIHELINFYSGYQSLTTFGLTHEKINDFSKPLFIALAIYLIVFVISCLLTIKKQYKANFILFFCLALFLSFTLIG